jgi:hypothetical protein
VCDACPGGRHGRGGRGDCELDAAGTCGHLDEGVPCEAGRGEASRDGRGGGRRHHSHRRRAARDGGADQPRREPRARADAPARPGSSRRQDRAAAARCQGGAASTRVDVAVVAASGRSVSCTRCACLQSLPWCRGPAPRPCTRTCCHVRLSGGGLLGCLFAVVDAHSHRHVAM